MGATSFRLRRAARLPRFLVLGPSAVAASLAFALAASASAQVIVERAFASVLAAPIRPLDAAPSLNAGGFYFLASDPRGPGVFLVSDRGGRVRDVHVGAPFASPQNLVVSGDNERLFVADPAAAGGGAIFVVDVHGGGVLGQLAQGHRPRAVDAVSVGDAELVYYTGVDPADGQPAVFRSRPDGSALAVVAKGAPMGEPSGLAVASNGDIYVADGPGRRDGGRILRISGLAVSELASGLWLGTPAGVALTLDEGILAVSGLTPATGGATVYLLDVATGAVSARDDGISQNREAGGVHRARQQNVFGWAGVTAGTAGGGGYIYRVAP